MDSHLDWARRVLRLVRGLHEQGYQLLRISPGVAPSGCYWRCAVTPKSNILQSHGAMLQDYRRLVASYTSAQGAACFGWEDATHDNSQLLATKFVERFADITAAARGEDSEYAAWYAQMLQYAERDHLPIAYADWPLDSNPRYIPLLGVESDLPMPPPGAAE